LFANPIKCSEVNVDKTDLIKNSKLTSRFIQDDWVDLRHWFAPTKDSSIILAENDENKDDKNQK
jgi:hypothetical protein